VDYNKNIICWSINISKILNDLELWHDLCKSAVKCSLWSNRIHLKLLTSDLKSTSKFTFSCLLHPRVDFNIHVLYIIHPPVDSKIQVLVLTSSSSRLQNSRFYSDFFLVCLDLYPQILTNFVVIYWTILNNVFDWPLLHIRAEQIKKHTRVNIQQLKKKNPIFETYGVLYCRTTLLLRVWFLHVARCTRYSLLWLFFLWLATVHYFLCVIRFSPPIWLIVMI
jgi:hypothetical protein